MTSALLDIESGREHNRRRKEGIKMSKYISLLYLQVEMFC